VNEGEDTLAARAKAGDPAALRQLVEEQGPKVAGLLVRLLGARGDLEDLVQTVFLEMCRSLPRFRGKSNISTFIGGITVHVARRAMKGSAWQRRRSAWPEREPRSDDPSQEEIADAREKLRRLHALLEEFSPEKRVAFLLWAVEGHPAEEVAALMGSTVFTARKRIYDVRRDLRKRAADDLYLRTLLSKE
jgi:RNA polymerase sigma-70 factor (ECF subfamily)